MDNKQRHPAPKTAGLPNILNTDDRAPTYNGHPHYRDSGFYSNGDTSSKRALPRLNQTGSYLSFCHRYFRSIIQR